MAEPTADKIKAAYEKVLRTVHNGLVEPKPTYANFIKQVYTSPYDGQYYPEDQEAVGKMALNYVAMSWKSWSGLEKNLTALAKAAPKGTVPRRSAIENVIAKDASKFTTADFMKAGYAGTKVAVKQTVKAVANTSAFLAKNYKLVLYVGGAAAALFLLRPVLQIALEVKKSATKSS